jgi:hypothetical protein
MYSCQPIRIAAVAATLAVAVAGAGAVTIGAEVTVDNSYGLYVGTPASLSFVGSDNDWSSVETYSFSASAGDYVYVAAWDWSGIQGFQGIVDAGSTKYRTNTTDWVVTIVAPAALAGWTAINGPAPSLSSLQSALSSATWSSIAAGATGSHSVQPWGAKVADLNTLWIWSDTLSDVSAGDGKLVVFRTVTPVVSAIPEPGIASMMAVGVAALGFLAHRRRRAERLR